jgi:hypothetical protein
VTSERSPDRLRLPADTAAGSARAETPGPAPLGNRASAALAAAGPSGALARAVAARGLGNRATAAMVQREPPRTTADMHAEIYGDSALAHGPSGSVPETFSDDPLADGGFGPGDATIRVKPGPVRTTFIKPKDPLRPSGEWLEEALKRDKLLKALPDWAREKAIDALKDADETAAEKIIDALPWDGQTKGAATAILKSLLQMAKGKRFVMPDAPPGTRQPEWQKLPDAPKMPGETIIQGPVWRF